MKMLMRRCDGKHDTKDERPRFYAPNLTPTEGENERPRNLRTNLTHAALATLLRSIARVGYRPHMPEFGRFLDGTNDVLPPYTQARTMGTGQMYDVGSG